MHSKAQTIAYLDWCHHFRARSKAYARKIHVKKFGFRQNRRKLYLNLWRHYDVMKRSWKTFLVHNLKDLMIIYWLPYRKSFYLLWNWSYCPLNMGDLRPKIVSRESGERERERRVGMSVHLWHKHLIFAKFQCRITFDVIHELTQFFYTIFILQIRSSPAILMIFGRH